MISVFSWRLLPGFCLALGASLYGLELLSSRPVEASTTQHNDQDGDLLPDDVEWALLTDPTEPDTDNDGIDDFLAAVTFVSPELPQDTGAFLKGDTERTALVDHAARVVVSIREQSGQSVVWVSFLFRFAGGTIPTISSFQPWIDIAGVTIPIGSALSAPGEFELSPPTAHGMFMRFSCPLALEAEVVAIGDSTIGADVTLDGLTLRSGVYLSEAVNRLIAFTPLGTSDGVMVPLARSVASDPFWTADRICWMSVSVVTSTGTGSICEITHALCRPGGSLRCPPTCVSSVHHLLYVPDGLSTLTGGG